MSTYLTTGIVLRKRNFREHDRLYTVYSREYGKLELLAKGSRKFASKLAAHLEPFAVVDLMVARGRILDRIASVERQQTYSGIQRDYQRATISMLASQLVGMATKGSQRDVRIYELLEELNEYLEDHAEERANDYNLLVSSFSLRLLSILGFQPGLDACACCKETDDKVFTHFSVGCGGVVCRKCFSSRNMEIVDAMPISEGIRQLAIKSMSNKFDKIVGHESDQVAIDQLVGITQELFEYHIEYEFPVTNYESFTNVANYS